MDQLPLFQTTKTPYSVSEINTHIRDLMEADEVLQDLWVKGEVSNLSRPRSGHIYFTLKDANAALRAVMWRNSAMRMVYQVQEGDQIEAHGSVSVYEVGGQYQIYVDQIRPAGIGSLYQKFQALKDKLEIEGLFELERKRTIPEFPKLIGIVTSPTGAALQDMLNTIRRRYPLTEVVLSPATVQGETASEEIILAIERLNQISKPDVILLARGGGSIEDLWAFNNENLARTILGSQAPVICGVGHETDFTIADFVADLRAATPTAAAELATPDSEDIHANLVDIQEFLKRSISDLIHDKRWTWQEVSNRLMRQSPKNRLLSDRQRLDELTGRATLILGHQLELHREKLNGHVQHLAALSPENVLERGFAALTNKEGNLIKSVNQVKIGDEIKVSVSDGQFDTKVSEK